LKEYRTFRHYRNKVQGSPPEQELRSAWAGGLSGNFAAAKIDGDTRERVRSEGGDQFAV
jgi:hypothetical protein